MLKRVPERGGPHASAPSFGSPHSRQPGPRPCPPRRLRVRQEQRARWVRAPDRAVRLHRRPPAGQLERRPRRELRRRRRHRRRGQQRLLRGRLGRLRGRVGPEGLDRGGAGLGDGHLPRRRRPPLLPELVPRAHDVRHLERRLARRSSVARRSSAARRRCSSRTASPSSSSATGTAPTRTARPSTARIVRGLRLHGPDEHEERRRRVHARLRAGHARRRQRALHRRRRTTGWEYGWEYGWGYYGGYGRRRRRAPSGARGRRAAAPRDATSRTGPRSSSRRSASRTAPSSKVGEQPASTATAASSTSPRWPSCSRRTPLSTDPNNPYGSTGTTNLQYVDISDPTAPSRRAAPSPHRRLNGWGPDNGRWNLDFADETARARHRLRGPVLRGRRRHLHRDRRRLHEPGRAGRSPRSPSRTSAGRRPRASTSAAGTRTRASTSRRRATTPQRSGRRRSPSTISPTRRRRSSSGSTTLDGNIWLFSPQGDHVFALGNTYTPNGPLRLRAASRCSTSTSRTPRPRRRSARRPSADGWSWSPAAEHLQGLRRQRAASLAVVPFSGWDYNRRYTYTNGVQLVSVQRPRASARAAPASPRGGSSAASSSANRSTLSRATSRSRSSTTRTPRRRRSSAR